MTESRKIDFSLALHPDLVKALAGVETEQQMPGTLNSQSSVVIGDAVRALRGALHDGAHMETDSECRGPVDCKLRKHLDEAVELGVVELAKIFKSMRGTD